MKGLAPLIRLKLTLLKNSLLHSTLREKGRILFLILLASSFVVGDYYLFTRIFRYLLTIKEFPFFFALGLTERLLGMVFLTSLSMLFISNIIVSLSTIYLSRDLDLLIPSPVKLSHLFSLKFGETLMNSSYMIIAGSVPIFIAYGKVFKAPFHYYPLMGLIVLLFLIPPAALGITVTMSLMRFFSAKRVHQVLSAVALIFGVAVVVVFRFMKPERLFSPKGTDDLVELLKSFSLPSFRFLPSSWAAKSLVAISQGRMGEFLLEGGLLLLFTVSSVILLAWVAKATYLAGFSGSQEQRRIRLKRRKERLERLLRFLFARSSPELRALVIKDIKLFVRDTLQWSQLFLLAALVIIYLFNIKNIPLPSPFIKNALSFLNLGLAGFVLAGVSARYAFPTTSLEGRSFWLIHSAPIDYRRFLWEKFLLFLAPLLTLALILVYTSNRLLGVDRYIMTLSLISITGMTLALTGMGVGMGAMFPKFNYDNQAKIAVSGGGLIYMLLSLIYIGLIIVLEARPVYLHFAGKLRIEHHLLIEDIIFYSGAGLITLIATLLPLKLGAKALSRYELSE